MDGAGELGVAGALGVAGVLDVAGVLGALAEEVVPRESFR